MGSKISQFREILDLNGEEEAVVAYGGANYKFKLKRIKKLISKEDLGLEKVNNTADDEKPVSKPQRDALDLKAEKDHEHEISGVRGLADALSDKANVSHNHDIGEVEGLGAALEGKSNTNHRHAIAGIDGLEDALGQKSSTGHTHSKSAIDGLNDDLAAMTQAINSKASSVHNHSTGQINGLEEFVAGVIEATPNLGDVQVAKLEW